MTGNATDGSTRMSLFMQVSSINVNEMVDALEHVRAEHRDPAEEDYIYNLVISEIGDTSGALYTSVLDALEEYLPGRSKQAFDNLFVGSAVLPWVGPGNPYREGMSNETFRWDNLMLQKHLWRGFAIRYPSVPWHCYITYEGVLDYFEEEPLRSYYEAYLVQSVLDAHEVRPGAAVMWAPAVWRDNALSVPEVTAISDTFHAVKHYANQAGHPKGVSWLHLQDMLGREWSGNTLADVRDWYWQLAGAFDFDSLRIDAELFTPSYQPIDSDTYTARMNYYDSHRIPVGGSWELRYWYRSHMEV